MRALAPIAESRRTDLAALPTPEFPAPGRVPAASAAGATPRRRTASRLADGFPVAVPVAEAGAARDAAVGSAWAAFSAPAPAPAVRVGDLVVPFSIASATWAAGSLGYRARISVATPATSAADMSVVVRVS